MQAGSRPVSWNMTYQGDADAEAAFRARALAEEKAAQQRNLEMMKGATRKPTTGYVSAPKPAPQPQQQSAPQPQQQQAAPKPAATPAATPAAATPAVPASAAGIATVAAQPPPQTDQPAMPASVAGMSMGDETPQPGMLGGATGMLRALGRRMPPMDSQALAGIGRRVY